MDDYRTSYFITLLVREAEYDQRSRDTVEMPTTCENAILELVQGVFILSDNCIAFLLRTGVSLGFIRLSLYYLVVDVLV